MYLTCTEMCVYITQLRNFGGTHVCIYLDLPMQLNFAKFEQNLKCG